MCITHFEGLGNSFQLVLVIDFHGTVDVYIASQEIKVENIGNILPKLVGDMSAHSA